MMILVAVVALGLGIADEVKTIRRADRLPDRTPLRRNGSKCQRIDAMDPATKGRRRRKGMGRSRLADPEWNHRMIPDFKTLEMLFRTPRLIPDVCA